MLWIFLLSCTYSSKIDSENPSEDTQTSENPQPSDDSALPNPSSEPTSEPESSSACTNEVLMVTPNDQAVDVLYRTPIEVELLEAETSAQLKLFQGDGEIAGESTLSNNVLSFTPQSPLLSNTSYSLEVHYCTDQIYSSSFTTGALGTPVETDLTGQTYVFDLRSGTWNKPVGAGALLSSFISADMLFGIEQHNDSTLAPLITVSEEDSLDQDMCFPTIGGVIDVNFTQNPFFEIEPVDVNINISGYPLNVQQFQLSGIFQPDGLSYEHGHIFGYIDARTLEAVTSFTAPQICSLLEGLGSACESCGDGQEYCFELEISELSGTTTSAPLSCVMLAVCHPLCNRNQCTNPNQGVCP